MRRSTLITRALGSAALVCAAVALSLVFVRHDAPAPIQRCGLFFVAAFA
ncbi:hypothetical protein ACWCP8_08925 [Streptomyces sp. NPDC002206]